MFSMLFKLQSLLSHLRASSLTVPSTIPCFYCDSLAKLHQDICFPELTVYCPICKRTDYILDILIQCACPEGIIDRNKVIDYLESFDLVWRRPTLQELDAYIRFRDQRLQMNTYFRKLKERSLDRSYKKMYSFLKQTVGCSPPGEAFRELLSTVLLAVMDDDLTEIIPDIPSDVIKNNVIFIVPFYSSLNSVSGLYFIFSKAGYFFTTISGVRSAGVGGGPNVFEPAKYHALYDDYLFFVMNYKVFVELICNSIRGLGVLPPLGLIFHGYGYTLNGRVPYISCPLPVTERQRIIVGTYRNREACQRIAIATASKYSFVENLSADNPLTAFARMVRRMVGVGEASKWYNIDYDLEGADELKRSAESLPDISSRIATSFGRSIFIGNKRVEVQPNGVFVDGKRVSNYIPAIYATTLDKHIFFIYHRDVLHRADVPLGTIRTVFKEILYKFSSDRSLPTLKHSPGAIPELWHLAKLFGDHLIFDRIPHVGSEFIRFNSQILIPGRRPEAVTPIYEESESEKDLGFLYSPTPPEVADKDKSLFYLALCLVGIPLARMLRLQEYSVILLTDQSRLLPYVARLCKFPFFITGPNFLSSFEKTYTPGWPCFVSMSSASVDWGSLLSTAGGIVMPWHPTCRVPWTNPSVVIRIDYESDNPSQLIAQYFHWLLPYIMFHMHNIPVPLSGFTSLLRYVNDILPTPGDIKNSFDDHIITMFDDIATPQHFCSCYKKLLALLAPRDPKFYEIDFVVDMMQNLLGNNYTREQCLRAIDQQLQILRLGIK